LLIMLRRLGFVLAVVILGAALSSGFSGAVRAQSPDQTTAIITSPVDGQQLFGLVNITGGASHPSAFDYYTLEYNDQGDPTASWLLVQPLVQQQRQNDVLGAWNTNMVPDGVYRLRLRVFLTDGEVGGEFLVSNLRVINSQPTPVPTAAGSETSLNAPTPGPSPTSPIQQPASNNPSAGEFSGQEPSGGQASSVFPDAAETSAQRTEKTTRINTSRVRGAFCTGVYLTLGIFGVMLVYRLTRGRLRPYTRQLNWPGQDDYDHE
jgi:hypothetical protein